MSGARLSARARANRANAAKSSGPRTREGKARVARNALIHGLAAAEPAPARGDVDALAGLFVREAGVSASPALEAAARDLAHAQLNLLAVRAIRRDYWVRLAAGAAERVGLPEEVVREAMPYGSRKLVRLLEAVAKRSARRREPLKNIEALERYERRALARRKWAARAFSDLAAGGAGVSDGRHSSRG